MTPAMVLALTISIITLVVFLAGYLSLNPGGTRRLWMLLVALLLGSNLLWFLGAYGGWSAADLMSLWAAVLVFPVTTILALTFFHGREFTRRAYLSLLILLPSLGLVIVSVALGWEASLLYDYPPVAGYAAICLLVSLAVSAVHWLRFSILEREGGLLIVALSVLLATGPIQSHMLSAAGAYALLGPNVGAPIFGFILLITLQRMDYPSGLLSSEKRHLFGSVRYDLERGRVHFINEARPKYLRAIFSEEIGNGKPGLVLTSAGRWKLERSHRIRGAAHVDVTFTDGEGTAKASDLARVYILVRDFAMSHGQGVVLLDSFPRLVCNNGLGTAKEFVNSLRELAEQTGCTMLVPLSKLTRKEFATIVRGQDSIMEFPDVETKVREILEAHIGHVSGHLLRTYCKSKGIYLKDLLLEDIPDLAVWVTGTLDALGVHAGDSVLLKNWKTESYRISLDLMVYFNSDLEEAQRLSIDPPVTTESLLSQVILTRRPPSPRRRKPPAKEPGVERREKLLLVFSKYFGEAGRFVLARELKEMGKSLEKLSLGDIRKLADRAQRTMRDFGEVVDMDHAGLSMESRGLLMREEITDLVSSTA